MKPLILALDTTHEFGSVALLRGVDLLEEALLHEPAGFAHVLYGHLESLLARQGVDKRQIDCFAAASGPGSFTGVRVGLAAVKGLAEALSRPAVGVSNLEAIAAFGSAALRAPLLDARRGEIYGAVYDASGALVLPEVVAKWEDWLKTLPAGAEIVTPDAIDLHGVPATASPRALAAAIGRIALGRYERGEACDPAALDANYVRRSDAELFWKE